jgi:hypothetical protein
MPSPPATPNQKPLPVLPKPTFKYGSNTYVVLAFAKTIKKEFSIFDVRNFTARYNSDYEVKRSLDVLEKNESVTKINPEQWKITPKGVTQVYDFARRKGSSVAYE